MKTFAITIIVILVVIFIMPFKVLFTYNGNILHPAPNTTITYAYKSGFISADSADAYYSTNRFGLTIFHSRLSNFDVGVYDATRALTTDHFSDLPGFFGPFIFLNMDSLSQRAIMVSKFFLVQNLNSNNDLNKGLDVLSLINSDDKTSTDFDFTLIPDNTNTRVFIDFSGEGGIQKIDAPIVLENSYPPFEYGTAPKEGYEKEIEILPGESYVARLRDGKHYMTLSYSKTFIQNFYSKDGTATPSCGLPICPIKLRMLIQPQENNNLSFTRAYPLKELNLVTPNFYYHPGY